MIRSLYGIFALIIICIIGCSGGGGGDGTQSVIDPQLLGVWEAISVTEDGVIVPIHTALEWKDKITKQTYEFFETGQIIRRNYDGEILAISDNGSCAAENQAGTLTFRDTTTNINYATYWDAGKFWMLDITYSKAGKNYTTRFINVATPTAHSPELLRTYNVSTTDDPSPTTVDGKPVPVSGFFDLLPDTNGISFQYLPDGTFIRRELQDYKVVKRVKGTWATGGNSLIMTLNSVAARGYFDAGGVNTTFLNDATGTTINIKWGQWGNSLSHPSELLGKWQPVSVTRDGSPIDLATFLHWKPDVTSATTEFWNDGTVESITYNGAAVFSTELGTWGVDNGLLFFKINKEISVSYTASGSSVSITMDASGHTYILTLDKI